MPVLSLALALPVGLLLLMLLMERVEGPLRAASVTDDLETFLDTARPDEVETFVSEGFAPALERYWSRRRFRGRRGVRVRAPGGRRA